MTRSSHGFLEQLAEHGLIKGARIGVDASTMEANAALRGIVRRHTGEGYRELLKRLAGASGFATPTADDLIRLDRKRPGKKLFNEDWQRPTDRDARIARLKDGRARLAQKPEHSVDLDTGAILAAPVHQTDRGATRTLPTMLDNTTQNLAAVALAATCEAPIELVADKAHHCRDGLKELPDSGWKTRISEPMPPVGEDGIWRWHGDHQARNAVYANRRRLLSGVAKLAFKLITEIVERAFALTLDRGGMRRTQLRGRDEIQKRCLIHIAGHHPGLVMRLLTGAGTPKRWAGATPWLFRLAMPLDADHQTLWLAIVVHPEPSSVATAILVIGAEDR